MSTFTTPLEVTPAGGKYWKLLTAFCYYTEDKAHEVCVPAGFKTDFASIPRVLSWLYPPYSDQWGKAAVVHDYLYATQPEWCDRRRADREFLYGMKALGCPLARRLLLYGSVRIWGWLPWRKWAT